MNTLFGGWKAGEGRSQIHSLQRHLFFFNDGVQANLGTTQLFHHVLGTSYQHKFLVTLPTKT
uniref:Putative ovule protein n=1 Tax=Solanum chacoense TaxID=4108 RepID=A0A0V0GUL8_SOLCH